MPTLKPHISKYPRKSDGKYKVSIEITQKRVRKYLNTGIYITEKQITKDKKIKDREILRIVLQQIKDYEDTILSKSGERIVSQTAASIKGFIEAKLNAISCVDFISFSRKYILDLIQEGELNKAKDTDRNKKLKRAKHIQTTINAFEDRFGKNFDITLLFADTLEKFEKHLRSERVIVRTNQFGREVQTQRKPLTNTGVRDYMIDIQTVFNAACKKYNKKSQGVVVIPNSPFEDYKIPQANLPHGSKYAEIEKIKRIITYQGEGRSKLGRDCFLLSFFLVGINSVDLYEMDVSCLHDDRLSYNRSKTEGRRSDGAFISIRLELEAIEIIKQYLDATKQRVFSFYRTYANSDVFNAAINKGIKKMRDDINKAIDDNIEKEQDDRIKKELANQKLDDSITYYSARHSWATIVRNTLGYSKYIVGECLNHSVDSLKITDRYIEKEFTWMDEINRKVIDLIYSE